MVKKELINYEALYEILRKEKYRTELQELDKDFFNDVVSYLNEKKNILGSQQKQEAVFPEEINKTKKQIENIQKMLKEIYEKRETKIIQSALFTVRSNSELDFSNMLEEEKILYKILVNELSKFKKDVLLNIISAKQPCVTIKDKILVENGIENKMNEKINKLVKVLNPIPKFVDTDLNACGPFQKDDTIFLPIKIADLLIKSKMVEEIENENTQSN